MAIGIRGSIVMRECNHSGLAVSRGRRGCLFDRRRNPVAGLGAIHVEVRPAADDIVIPAVGRRCLRASPDSGLHLGGNPIAAPAADQ